MHFCAKLILILAFLFLIPCSANNVTSSTNSTGLLNAFRLHYEQFHTLLISVYAEATDPFLLQLLGEDLEEFSRTVDQHASIFEQDELHILRTGVQLMIVDVRALHSQQVEASHHGRPELVHQESAGNRGRPRTEINPEFLRWAYGHRTTSGISHFLGVSRATVRRRLLDNNITSPGSNPFPSHSRSSTTTDEIQEDDVLDTQTVLPASLPDAIYVEAASIASTSSSATYLSSISDAQLDSLLGHLRVHYCRAGIRILDGMLRQLGHIVPYDRIQQSLLRIDPIHRVFDRIRIRRRGYSVPGPNSLWHHDGHHRLIRWGIVVHGFIDGYSRMITGLRASNNNRGETVLSLFLAAADQYGIPSRLRGDHGVENIWAAAFMEHVRGEGRGSYIWGRSVHNVRIERLWVDVSHYITQTWHDLFTNLELHHGLDISNMNHIWLLQHLFLSTINEQLAFWAEGWNHHRVSQRHGPSRSPEDMFGFDMIVNGLRGESLEQVAMTDEELEVFGVDWEGLKDEVILRSLRKNYRTEGAGSWLGQQGPPAELNQVVVDPPSGLFTSEQIAFMDQQLQGYARTPQEVDVVHLWTTALALARSMSSHDPALF